jgi:predicted oxidoreductase
MDYSTQGDSMTPSTIKMGSDLTLSRIIPGLMRLLEWKMSREELTRWIQACYEMGITSFDHADIYGSFRCEAVFGEALAASPGLRDKIKLITKCNIAFPSPQRPQYKVHHYDSSKAHILQSVDNSLRNFHTDRLDLLLIHRHDFLMDADEVASAMAELRRAGKVLHFGVSNFPTYHVELLQSRLDFPLATNQIEFSVTHYAPIFDGTLDQCQRLRMPPMAWSPVGGGSLFTGDDERSARVRQALQTAADQIGGVGIDQIALAWILKHPVKVLPVLGTGKLERIRAAIDAEQIQLDREQWYSIYVASAGQDIP